MSLYANIYVSNNKRESIETPKEAPSKKAQKSAALYAGVVAKPPEQLAPKPAPVEEIRQQTVIEAEPEKPTEASGTDVISSRSQ